MRGRARLCVFVLLCASAACSGDDGVNKLPDAPLVTLRIDPPDAEVTVVNGVAVMQAYTATLISPDGSERDVTDHTAFTLRDANYGVFTASALAITGRGAGPTRVQADVEGVAADTGLTVFVKAVVIDPDVDPGTPGGFDGATEDATLAPTVRYPLDNILVPPNLGQFDVHWTQATANVFEIKMSNPFVDIRRYSNGDDPAQPYWMVFPASEWYPIASSRVQLTLQVTGMVAGDPTRKGTAATQRVDVTNEDSRGGIYYWQTSPSGIYRYDIAKPEVAPAPFFPEAQPSGCIGCHSLSRDGTKIAMTIDSAGGRGAVFDVADRSVLVPFDAPATAYRWNQATFTADNTKLVTATDGVLTLRDVNGGAPLATVPVSPSEPSAPIVRASHPDMSPDNLRLANVEATNSSTDIYIYGGSIVTHTFDPATNTFGPPQVLVAADAQAQIANYYPSFSPDGKWIAFTRTTNYSYDDPSAEAWVVRADGSAPPIKLATANLDAPNLTNSWSRWVPFEQTAGPNREKLFYLTFSSKRPFGVRIPGGNRPQIWMTPFFPDRAEAGLDPSGPTFRVPFQNVLSNNHIAQWTQSVVAQKPAPAARAAR